MARPKKAENEKRKYKHTIHLNADEYKSIRLKANKMKTSISGFLRAVAGRSVLIEPDPTPAKLLRELSRIGTNLNQIAKNSNTSGVNLSLDDKKGLNELYLSLEKIKKAVLKNK